MLRGVPRILIETPSRFDTEERLNAFLKEVLTLPQDLPEVQDAIADVRAALAAKVARGD